MKFTRNQKFEIINLLYQYDMLDGKFSIEDDLDHDLSGYYYKIVAKLDEIDETIINHLENYTLNRLSYLDRAIIRYATFDLLYSKNSVALIINDAIEITKTYTDLDDGKQHKFTNRLLQNIASGVK